MVHLTFRQSHTLPIFCGEIDGKRIRTDPHTLDISRKIRFVAIIPYGHTFATMALQNGVDVKTVSSMLGHYDAGFTLRTYTHATRKAQNDAAEKLDSFMTQVM